jgi:hypothetical protein
LDSSFLRIRRSSIKLSALIVQITDANIIITIVSIGAGSSRSPLYQGPLLRARVNPAPEDERYRRSHGNIGKPFVGNHRPGVSALAGGWKMIFDFGYGTLALDGNGESSTRFQPLHPHNLALTQ